jgi:hypothetical protein
VRVQSLTVSLPHCESLLALRAISDSRTLPPRPPRVLCGLRVKNRHAPRSLKHAQRLHDEIEAAEELAQDEDEAHRGDEEVRVGLAVLQRLAEPLACVERFEAGNVRAHMDAEVAILAVDELEDAVLYQMQLGEMRRWPQKSVTGISSCEVETCRSEYLMTFLVLVDGVMSALIP